MFSDEVLLHGGNGVSDASGTVTTGAGVAGTAAINMPSAVNNNQSPNNFGEKNVCSSEKMTQTGL